MPHIAGIIKSPQQITTASLRALYIPNKETGQVANAGCSQLTDLTGNGFDLIQATGSLQPLWKQDTTYGGKWYIKFDGVNDFLAASGNPVTTNTAQLFIVLRNSNSLSDTLACSKFVYTFNNSVISRYCPSTSGGLAYQVSSAAGEVSVVGSTGYSLQQAAVFVRKTGSGNFQKINGVTPNSTIAYNAASETSGIKLGGNTANNSTGYWSGEIACVAIFEGTDLTTNDITGLFNWAKIEFNVYRDLLSNKI